MQQIEYIKTNIGPIPLEDYLDIKAREYGFDSYAQLQAKGYHIDIKTEDIVKEEQ